MKTIYKFGYKWYKTTNGYVLKEHIDNKMNEVAYIFYSYGKWREDKISLATALEELNQ